MKDDVERIRARLVSTYAFNPCPAPPDEKVGIARNVRSGLFPINGVRYGRTPGMTGWYIWAGEELSTAPDFFVPLHVSHLIEWCPIVIPYLELPPGWRFLLAPDFEDVWFDPSVNVSGNT